MLFNLTFEHTFQHEEGKFVLPHLHVQEEESLVNRIATLLE
jgi:hypothetical protein